MQTSSSTTAPHVCAFVYQFTGKERDNETGNDYFGARYYNSAMARWMSPDWSAKTEPVPYAKMDDPQTLNLYGYVGNNPLSDADLDGHASWEKIKEAATQIIKSGSVKLSAGVGIEESIGTEAAHISVGLSATAFVSVSSKGVTTGSDVESGAEVVTPLTGKLGTSSVTETLSKKDGIELPEPGERSTEQEMGIGAMTDSKETFSIGDKTAAGPALGLEMDINKEALKEGFKNLAEAIKAPNHSSAKKDPSPDKK